MISHIKAGSPVIYPTETSYGIGCDAANQKAVDAIFRLKKRPRRMTLPLIAASLAMVKRYCVMSAREEKVARKYWPGPLTMILGIKEPANSPSPPLGKRGMLSPPPDGGSRGVLSHGVVAPDHTVAIRVSSHPIASALSRRLGRPIVSTSANLHGAGECYSVADVKRNLLSSSHPAKCGEPAIQIIDGGRLKKRKPSTIVRVIDGKAVVLRQGENIVK